MIKAVGLNAAIGGASSAEAQKKRLKEACQDFEAVMTNYLFKAMRENVMRAEEPDQMTDLMEGMMGEAFAKDSSRNDNLGLANMLYRQLLPLVPESGEKSSSTLKESSGASDSSMESVALASDDKTPEGE
ncbi:MAG: rod-binding protein [Syntrophobacteraceae bacterium]